MAMLDILDLYLDGLPEDFFDEQMQEMIAEEKNLMFIPNMVIETPTGDIRGNGVVVLDRLTGQMTTGRKYPVEPTYEVKADLEPSEIMFNWVESFYNGENKKVPHIPIAAPLIPPSRFAKSTEFYDVYTYFLNAGYSIFMPTRGQQAKYPDECKYTTVPKGKYICNTMRDFRNCKGDAVMLDFNPYNPIGIMSIKEVKIIDVNCTYYRRIWKDTEIEGVFDKRMKRYHYDSWGNAILGTKYYGAVKIRSFDIVVKDYNSFEKLVPMHDPQYRSRPLLNDPIHVDPYYVSDVFWHPYRSNLPFRIDTSKEQGPVRVCLPWNNYKLGDMRSGERFDKTYESYHVVGTRKFHLPTIHSEVVDIKKKHSSNWTNDETELVSFASQVFVQRRYLSDYDGSVVRRDASCRSKYVCSFIRNGRGPEVMCYVPYKISRYPCNHEGTLIDSLMMLTLEEFHARWQELYSRIKLPWWIEELPENYGGDSAGVVWESVTDLQF